MTATLKFGGLASVSSFDVYAAVTHPLKKCKSQWSSEVKLYEPKVIVLLTGDDCGIAVADFSRAFMHSPQNTTHNVGFCRRPHAVFNNT